MEQFKSMEKKQIVLQKLNDKVKLVKEDREVIAEMLKTVNDGIAVFLEEVEKVEEETVNEL